MSELIPRMHYTKNWEDPADYATRQTSEVQNRKDLQSLFTEIATYINDIMLPKAEQLLSSGGSGDGTGGGGADGDYLPLSGGTMQGILRLYRNPQLSAEAATKRYVDTETGSVRTDMEENLTAIRQNAQEIELLAQNNAGEIASLKVTAQEISTRVENAEGDLSTLSQRADAIESRVTNAEGDISTISQTVDNITLSVGTVTQNGEIYSRITLKIGENELYGFIKMEGNVDISGQLSTEVLYAGYGEVANLAVDQLLTSRRIVKYLSGDTSDDNFIRAYEQTVEWVTGVSTGGTAQAVNPDGSPLYWPVDVSGLARGADGYPRNSENERIFTTTTPTEYPVRVYTYNEAVKRSISFENVNGIYSPIDRFGAGNKSGSNRAWIFKTADGFDIRYLTPASQEVGVRMSADGSVVIDGTRVSAENFVYDGDKIRALLGLGGGGSGLDLTTPNDDGTQSGLVVDGDGYTDLLGLRKAVTIDFSRLSDGFFSETLDGGVYNPYTVTRDSAGRISSITDAAGHVTNVLW